MQKPTVAIIMGSQSDLKVMGAAADALEGFGVTSEVTVVSAHRTPARMYEYATKAQARGIKVIIAGAGGAAHLPGMVASLTTLPVIGVPVLLDNSLNGLDALLSIAQMPEGIPVATVAINGAKNAGILAASIVALEDKKVALALIDHKKQLRVKVENSVKEISRKGYKAVRSLSKAAAAGRK